MYQSEPFCLLRKKERFWDFYTASSRWWTEEQIEFLKKNATMPQKWLADKLGKSVQSVNMKALRLRRVSP